MQKLILPYSEIKAYINEGDVLLFRGKGFISSIIGSQTDTDYSHIAVASWSNGDANTIDGMLECVEFREGKGGRTTNLEVQVEQNPNQIDVYRAVPNFSTLTFVESTKEVLLSQKDFNGRAVTRIMRKMTGLPYGWRRIWWMAKKKLIFLRLFSKRDLMSDKLTDIVYPVCSTAVAYAFNTNGFDLINNRSDEWCEPGDISKSSRLNYLFTLGV